MIDYSDIELLKAITNLRNRIKEANNDVPRAYFDRLRELREEADKRGLP